jgi:hypothetical protein
VTVNPAPAPTSTGPPSGGYGATLSLSGSAVPGDRVALYTRPPGGGTWQRWGSVLAASSGKWTVPYRLTHDVEWEVTAPSGVSSVRKVVVVPTIVAPSTATKGATITVHGTAIPGQAVGVYRRQFGHATWYRVALVTAGPTGAWSAKIRVYYSPSIQARSHGQTSRTLVVKTS